jgi:hypothetical protein
MIMSGTWDGAEVVRPAEMAHDQAALDAASVAEAEAEREWHAAARELDIAEGVARRTLSYDRAELQTVRQREQAASDRLDRCRRARQERQVVAILDAATGELDELARADVAAREAAQAALDEVVDSMQALNRARAGVDAQLRQAAGGDLPVRLRLTGTTRVHGRLPQLIVDPAAVIDGLGAAARRRAIQLR